MNNMEPEKKDVWGNIEQRISDQIDLVDSESSFRFRNMVKDAICAIIRQNFIPRAEVVEKANKIAYLSDDLGGGKAVSLDDLLDLLTQEK